MELWLCGLRKRRRPHEQENTNGFDYCCLLIVGILVMEPRVKNFKLTTGTRSELIQKIKDMDLTNPMRTVFSKWSNKRSITMNAQQHLFYGQIAKFYGDRTALDVKNECKDKFGLPILHNSAIYGDKIEFLLDRLNYYKYQQEGKMKLIQCLAVTSEFNTSESKEYSDNMIYYFNDIGCPIKFKEKDDV